jgi:hypothetical protein
MKRSRFDVLGSVHNMGWVHLELDERPTQSGRALLYCRWENLRWRCLTKAATWEACVSASAHDAVCPRRTVVAEA